MAKIFMSFICLALLACGKSKSPRQMVKEICDCFENKGNDCLERYYEAEKKVMNNKKKTDEFNQAMKECTMYLINLPKNNPHHGQ